MRSADRLYMELLDHVSITVVDLTLARRFYDAVMAALSCDKVYDLVDAIAYGTRSNAKHAAHTYLCLCIAGGRTGRAPSLVLQSTNARCGTRVLHRSPCTWRQLGWRAGPETALPCLVAAFVRDPSGNRLEAVCHLTAQTELVNSS